MRCWVVGTHHISLVILTDCAGITHKVWSLTAIQHLAVLPC